MSDRNSYINKILAGWRGIVADVNYTRIPPSLQGITLRVLGFRETYMFEGKAWAICPQCDGTNDLTDQEWAKQDYQDDKGVDKHCYRCYNNKQGRPTGFNIPMVDHYKQACLLTCMWKLHTNAAEEIEKIAKSEINYIGESTDEYLVEMKRFWVATLDRFNRAKHNGIFITDEDLQHEWVQHSVRSLTKAIDKQLTADCIRLGYPLDFVMALRAAERPEEAPKEQPKAQPKVMSKEEQRNLEAAMDAMINHA